MSTMGTSPRVSRPSAVRRLCFRHRNSRPAGRGRRACRARSRWRAHLERVVADTGHRHCDGTRHRHLHRGHSAAAGRSKAAVARRGLFCRRRRRIHRTGDANRSHGRAFVRDAPDPASPITHDRADADCAVGATGDADQRAARPAAAWRTGAPGGQPRHSRDLRFSDAASARDGAVHRLSGDLAIPAVPRRGAAQ